MNRSTRYDKEVGHNIIEFIDYNDFIKKYRSLKTYCPNSYKYISFNALTKIPITEEKKYILDIPTERKFEKVYGKIQLVYSIFNNRVIIENLLPEQILLDGHKTILSVYKGLPIRNEKDKFKIDMIIKLEEKR